jgi:hypothetical protein
LDWLAQKAPHTLPKEAWNALASFEIDYHGQQIECVSVDSEKIWTARLTHPDMPHGDRAGVAGRTWTTEIGLHLQGEKVTFGIRTVCASLPDTIADLQLTRPRIVVDMIEKFGLSEIEAIDVRPKEVRTEEDLALMASLLVDPLRTLPVILLTQPDRRRLPVAARVAPYVLDVDALARRAAGIAHVVLLPSDRGFGWTDLVGKEWSAFHGSVRTYYPGLSFEDDSPYSHPLASLERILFWSHDNLAGEEAFAEFLLEKTFAHGASKRMDWKGCLFLADAKAAAAKAAKESARDNTDWNALYEGEILALKRKLEEVVAESEQYNDDAIEAVKEQQRLKEENSRLRAANDGLRSRLSQKNGESPDAEVPILSDYESLPEWIQDHFIGRLVLHPRAKKGLKDARFEDVGLVYKCLVALANEYRSTQLGEIGSGEAWEKTCESLGVRCSKAISETRAGEQGEEYFVKYPPGTVRNRLLEWHLRKGSSKDERYCMAIYYFWDEDSQQVIVGGLPRHLDNRLT